MEFGNSKAKYLAITSLFEAVVFLLVIRCTFTCPSPFIRLFALCSGLISILTLLLIVLVRQVGIEPMDQFFPDSEYSHCFICDKCVWRRDHHCPWMNVCIGERNRGLFVLYLFSTTCCLYALTQSFCDNTQALFLLLSTAALFTCLTAYHVSLVLVGTHSAEFVKMMRRIGP